MPDRKSPTPDWGIDDLNLPPNEGRTQQNEEKRDDDVVIDPRDGVFTPRPGHGANTGDASGPE